MSGERKYIFVLATIAVFFIIFELASPEKTNWNITYHKNDKNPYGSYLIHERLPDLFEKVNHSYSTIYELADTVQGDLFVLSQQFNPSKEDVKALLKYISKGNNALIASSFFDKEGFLDTLDLSTDYFLIDNIIMEGKEFTDSVDVSFTKPNKLDPAKFSFDSDAINTYFQSSNNFEILASLDELPVFIEKDHGVGKLYLCTIPIAFTNNYLLHEQTDILISQMFSHLPYGDFTWTEYYQIGRLEARTPLRYILSEEALKMAYYLILISLGFFIFFEIKRKVYI